MIAEQVKKEEGMEKKEETLHILLIEDSGKQADEIQKSYENAIKKIKEAGLLKKHLCFDEVTIEWLQGTEKEKMRKEEQYWFYNEGVYEAIESKMKEHKGERIGILLDVALSKEEYKKASVNDYSGFKIARNIFERFEKKARIYIVTSIREYSSQVLSLMGTRDLIERYISKALITEYPSYGAMGRTIRFMYDGKILDEEQEDDLDRLQR